MKDVTENTVLEIEEVEDVEVTALEPEESEGGVLGTVVKAGAVIGGVVLIGHVVKKNWSKLKAYGVKRAVAKAEKAGYVCVPCDEIVDSESEEEDITDDDIQ